MTPQATDTEPGILRCYDTELFLEAIREGSENADFCIAFVHWGTEYSFELQQVQTDTGRQYLDAGADVVIGAHSHCLQGMEYYEGSRSSTAWGITGLTVRRWIPCCYSCISPAMTLERS